MAEQEPAAVPKAATVRARLILEVAADMAAAAGEPYREPEVRLRVGRGSDDGVTLSASSTVDGIEKVVAGTLDVAFVNPSCALAVAHSGKGSYFTGPQPVRAVAVLPSEDQCMLAVAGRTGLTHVEDIARRKYPLRIAMRGLEGHWLTYMLEDVFRAAGFSCDDLRAWGGALVHEGHIPEPGDAKFAALASGAIDAMFDEGVGHWANAIVPAGMTVLQLEDATLAKLETMGYRRGWLRRALYPTLPADLPVLDFSGWGVFVRADADDALVERICAGLENRKALIPWRQPGPLPVADMCRDGPGAPLGAPLHPAAARYWRGRGYI